MGGTWQAFNDVLYHFVLVLQVVSFDSLEDEELEVHNEEKGMPMIII